MSSGLLTLCKYVFLVVLYLFFVRVLRAVWVELREPKVLPIPAVAQGAAASVTEGDRRPRKERRHDGELRITQPEERKGQTFELGDELTVGRAAGCGVSLPEDTFVSQVHARVFRRDGDLWVEDLGSTNGTLLNDRRVSAPVAMRKGDVLQVGRTTLVVST